MEEQSHGGGIDAAARRYGGRREEWLDLSTGINPHAYQVPKLAPDLFRALPDLGAKEALVSAARAFWSVPEGAAVLPVPGLSSVIGRLPTLAAADRVAIPGPTYNEYAPAFARTGWQVEETDPSDDHAAAVIVHPNNPTGRWHEAPPRGLRLRIIDESFCDLAPARSLIAEAAQPGTLILKGLGKFWGLAGLRLGFVIGDGELIDRLAEGLGPWSVSGPALEVGRLALSDHGWADDTRSWLDAEVQALDRLMAGHGAQLTGGTALFRLYEVPDAAALQERLARHHIWTRIFPWSSRHIRLGVAGPAGRQRLAAALPG